LNIKAFYILAEENKFEKDNKKKKPIS